MMKRRAMAPLELVKLAAGIGADSPLKIAVARLAPMGALPSTFSSRLRIASWNAAFEPSDRFGGDMSSTRR